MGDPNASNSIAVYLGVDVSNDSVDICAVSADARVLWRKDRVPRTAAAIQAAVKPLAGRRAVAVLEATGGLEKVPARALEAVGIGVTVENPAQVRHYALSHGKLEKSDRIDAHMLGEFGCERRPRARVEPDREIETLALLTARRRQLVGLRAAERTRFHGETLEFNRRSLAKMIEALGKLIDEITQEIRDQVRATEALRTRYELLQSAPGVGATTASELTAWLPELGDLSREAAAKLVGVAPLIKQSGRWRGQTRTQGGRGRVRRALYMAALSAVRCDGYFRACYLRLVGRGKAKKSALIAVARLLLGVLNQMLRHQRAYDPTLLPAASG